MGKRRTSLGDPLNLYGEWSIHLDIGRHVDNDPVGRESPMRSSELVVINRDEPAEARVGVELTEFGD